MGKPLVNRKAAHEPKRTPARLGQRLTDRTSTEWRTILNSLRGPLPGHVPHAAASTLYFTPDRDVFRQVHSIHPCPCIRRSRTNASCCFSLAHYLPAQLRPQRRFGLKLKRSTQASGTRIDPRPRSKRIFMQLGASGFVSTGAVAFHSNDWSRTHTFPYCLSANSRITEGDPLAGRHGRN